MILLIETSTERGVIACAEGSSILFAEQLPFGSAQSRYLMPALAKNLSSRGLKAADLACIGVGVGPGSYTGIRLGVSVAQALAYSWQLPLVGVCSLDGFIPSAADVSFAAVMDARIGGLYARKGYHSPTGISYTGEPKLYTLEEAGDFLADVKYLVTPFKQSLQAKLQALYPDCSWMWEEKSPSVEALASRVKTAYESGERQEIGHLKLLYLRETEAERARKT